MARPGVTGMGRKAGVSLLEVAAGLGIMGMVALGVMQVSNDQSQATKALAAAQQLDQVRAATQDWVRANYPQLAANLPVGGAPVLVPVARTVPGGAVPGPVTVGAAVLPSLQGGGFVPPGAVDRNAYGQSHALLVRQPVAGTIDALVVQTGGQPIRDADLGRIVQRVGSAGGARFATNANPAMATMVQGSGGSWVQDTAVWTAGGVTPQVSRAAASVTFGNQSLLSDFLNRYDIGIPEANTMRTALNMGGQDVNNAATVRANQAVLQNGGMACAGNATGCAFWISDDGRFADFNDGWVRFQGSYAGGGLTVEGPAGGGNLWVGGTAMFMADASVARDLTVGRTASVAGDLGAARVWTGYLQSTGSVDTQTLNVGQSAAIWGAGGLWVANNAAVGGQFNVGGNAGVGGSLSVAGNVSTPNSVFAGYVRSAGSVDAGMDLNATRNVTAGSYIWSGGGIDGASLNSRGGANVAGNIDVGNQVSGNRVVGRDGLRTMAWRSPNAWCNWGGDEAGMIALSTSDGGLLSCNWNWQWAPVGGGPMGVVRRGGWGFGGFGCDPGYYYDVIHFNVGNTNNAFIPMCVRYGY